MFALQDHLPLDRIITRFSAPTTITQFQRSSLDGILIELARLVTHGANDNIFCLSGLIESAGWGVRGKCWRFKAGHGKKRTRWFWFIPICFLLDLSLSPCCSMPSCSATIHAMKITGLAFFEPALLYYTPRATLPCKWPCKLRAVQAWCMVRG